MAKYSPYKMKGHTLPGIKQKEADKLEDGRPGSSALQYKKSPNKWVQFVPMALSALSSMKKNKENQGKTLNQVINQK